MKVIAHLKNLPAESPAKPHPNLRLGKGNHRAFQKPAALAPAIRHGTPGNQNFRMEGAKKRKKSITCSDVASAV
jgi:hypothetical protein